MPIAFRKNVIGSITTPQSVRQQMKLSSLGFQWLCLQRVCSIDPCCGSLGGQERLPSRISQRQTKTSWPSSWGGLFERSRTEADARAGGSDLNNILGTSFICDETRSPTPVSTPRVQAVRRTSCKGSTSEICGRELGLGYQQSLQYLLFSDETSFACRPVHTRLPRCRASPWRARSNVRVTAGSGGQTVGSVPAQKTRAHGLKHSYLCLKTHPCVCSRLADALPSIAGHTERSPLRPTAACVCCVPTRAQVCHLVTKIRT